MPWWVTYSCLLLHTLVVLYIGTRVGEWRAGREMRRIDEGLRVIDQARRDRDAAARMTGAARGRQ
jgi:hypothetical protein